MFVILPYQFIFTDKPQWIPLSISACTVYKEQKKEIRLLVQILVKVAKDMGAQLDAMNALVTRFP